LDAPLNNQFNFIVLGSSEFEPFFNFFEILLIFLICFKNFFKEINETADHKTNRLFLIFNIRNFILFVKLKEYRLNGKIANIYFKKMA
jgi:hypothetical protein